MQGFTHGQDRKGERKTFHEMAGTPQWKLRTTRMETDSVEHRALTGRNRRKGAPVPGAPHWTTLNSTNTKKPNDWGLHNSSGMVLGLVRGLSWWILDQSNRPTFRLLSHGPWRQFENGNSRMAIRVGRSAACAGGSPGRHDYAARQSRDPRKRPMTPQRREGHRYRPPENLCVPPASAVNQSG